MSVRSPSNLAIAGLCLLGVLLLGLAVWAAADADEEPTPVALSAADLEPTDADGSKGRVEVVRTGDRLWVKLQVRGIPDRDSTLVFIDGSEDDPLEVPVDGDGDYTLSGGTAPPTSGRTELRQDGALLLSGTLVAED